MRKLSFFSKAKKILKGVLFLVALIVFSYAFLLFQKNNKELIQTVGTSESVALVNPVALEQLITNANTAHSDAIVILKDGQLVGAWHADGDIYPIQSMSMAKSVVNLVIGRLLTLGLIESLDQPMYTFFPEWDKDPYRQITLRHILNHTSGIQANRSTPDIYIQRDFVQYALEADLVNEPGTHFFYNNKTVNLLPAVVEQVTGKRMDTFLEDDLFAIMDITDFGWDLDRAGNPHGMSGLQTKPENFAKLGQLALDRGIYEGEQLIDNEWFEVSTSPGASFTLGHGLLWWLTAEQKNFIIDDEQIALYRNAGASETFLGQIEQLKGEYATWEQYIDAVEAELGADYESIIVKERGNTSIPLGRREYGELIFFKADGDLGQQIIIFPEDGLVGVRFYSGTLRQRFVFNSNVDYYEDFANDLQMLLE